MPVNDAEGDEVGLADSEPPGVDAAVVLGAVVVVLPLVAVVVFVIDEPAIVVVVAPVALVVVVELDFEPDVWCFFEPVDEWFPEVFLEAEGVDEPHAAAIRPPTRTTTPTAKVRPTRRRPRLLVE
jgi:hypothetical protein